MNPSGNERPSINAPPEDGPAGALVLFSGGQDSATCLAYALDRYGCVETLGFDYGQRHAIELEARENVRAAIMAQFAHWAEKLGADHILDISSFGAIGESALTTSSDIVTLPSGLPSTFVPGRNLVFFVYAAALAARRGLDVLVGGMCETDYSGYPDCRDETLKALQQAIRLGTELPITIETPLMWLTKAETWGLAAELGGAPLVEIIRKETHTCYHGDHETMHEWGYGCGACPACALRAEGYRSWQAATAGASS